MLLVKSRESKSSDRKNPIKTWVWTTLGPCFFIPFGAFAEAQSLSNPTSIASIFLSLLLVIAIVFALALLMRRFNVTASGNGQLKVVASMVAGTRERVMVIEVGQEQHLIGVTATNINHLAKLDTPLDSPEKSATAVSFKDKLTVALAGKIQSGMATAKGQSNV
ncbi:flagellar biosynthetic protein FliO [Aliiglaciecola sp. LCG003]|uniref:flagellar biosynthetic protein FliO n=1 Tax=Aliiglaciecola sp. LCG003 TaxID=3053655 RepID=UPI002573CDC4|nr:flagellar biosynthetic protein FliO [Aliiglaciecola sp. LCG003]WJG10616.1 flagellar biosynthetic protein FliO [Aliiglaciecola sp. LCG003]